MAPTSRYHRGANSSHYQSAPSTDEEHMYASPATAWQSSSHTAGPSSAPFSSSVQRPLSDYTGSTDYVNQAPWPTTSYYSYRPGWSDSREDDAFAPRSIASYGDAGVHTSTAPVPHHDPGAVRQQQQQQPPPPQSSNATHEVQLLNSPENVYGAVERLDHLRISSVEYSAASNPPLYPPIHAQRPTPLAGLLNAPQQMPTMPINPPHLPLHPPISWGAVPISDVPLAVPQQLPSITSDILSSGIAPPNQSIVSSPPWVEVNTAEATSSTTNYDRMPDAGTVWPLSASQPDNGGYLHQHIQPPHLPPLPQMHQLTQLQNSAVLPRANRRASKSAKVPSAFIERQEKNKISKRKGPLEEEKRRMTHHMRKEKKVCVRCKFYKSGCDDGDPCKKCTKIEGNARSFREPCFRDHLEDTSLVRHCNGRFNQEEAEFLSYDWVPGSNIYEMDIIWNLPGYGPIHMGQPLRVAFRQYYPKRAVLDTATSVWRNTDGEVKAIQQPPYAIYDTQSLIPALERWFLSMQSAIENWIFSRVRHDEIALLTYQEVARMRATKTSGKPNLLDLAMHLQCMCVVSQGYGSVLSKDVPGIQEYDFRLLGRSGYDAYDRNQRDQPVPGAMTHQFDVSILKSLRKLEKVCVKELVAQIFKPKLKPWYELFLTFFILFWNLEYIHHSAEKYIMSKNGTMIENQVSRVVRNQIKKWDESFDVLMKHWRCILRGYEPFKIARENPEEFREKGHIEPEGFDYVMKLAEVFDRRGASRHQPPVSGPLASQHSLASRWIRELLKETGA